MKVIIVGAGKVGYYLAKNLSEHMHDVCVIDKDKSKCKIIANEIDNISVFCADGTTIAALENAGVFEAQAIVGATGKDECNLVACQLAKSIYHVEKTIARVNNPKNVEPIKKLGVDIVINSTNSITNLLEREVDNKKIKQVMSLSSSDSSINEIELPDNSKIAGKKLSQLDLPHNMIIISITRNGTLIIPRGNTVIEGGDRLLVLSENTLILDYKNIFCL